MNLLQSRQNKNNAKQRTKAISGAPIIKGTKMLPNPPINIGITIKKIINIA